MGCKEGKVCPTLPFDLQVIFTEEYSHFNHMKPGILKKLPNFYDVRLVKSRLSTCSKEHPGAISFIARMLGCSKSSISRGKLDPPTAITMATHMPVPANS